MRTLLVFVELERDRISEYWDTATNSAIARGIHVAKFTSIGYDKGLRPNTDAPAIRQAFLMRAATKHAPRSPASSTRSPRAPKTAAGPPSNVERIIKSRIVKRTEARTPVERRVTILWRGEGPDDLPRRGRDNGPVRPYAP